jgi:hypothetical protein
VDSLRLRNVERGTAQGYARPAGSVAGDEPGTGQRCVPVLRAAIIAQAAFFIAGRLAK